MNSLPLRLRQEPLNPPIRLPLRLWSVLATAFLVLAAVACNDPQANRAPAARASSGAAGKAEARLVVYSGRGEVLVGPLFEKFEKKTGIALDVRWGKTSLDLANRLAQEGKLTRADVFLAQDSGYLGALGRQGHLAALDDDVFEKLTPGFVPQSRKWVPTSGRARVLVYNPQKVSEDRLPKRLEDLPKFDGAVGWAPQNGSFQAHTSALRAIWGEDATRTWLEAMKTSEPKQYPKNSPQVKAVHSGEIQVGWVNHYYAHKIRKSQPDLAAKNYSFPTAADAGNVMMLSGVGVTAYSKQKELALRLVAFLVSEEAQEYFAREVFEYPTRSGISGHPDVPPLSELKLTSVDQTTLTDVEPTLKMLREVGLL